MTIDMFRMIQTLEREKRHEDFNHTSDPPSRASFVSFILLPTLTLISSGTVFPFQKEKSIIMEVSTAGKFFLGPPHIRFAAQTETFQY